MADKDASLPAEEKIARDIEEDIIFGRLAPGERLTEDALLARFETSRHFVRHALSILQNKGVVVRKRNRGATVCRFDAGEVLEIYEARELVQREAALRLPLPVPTELVSRLSSINSAYRDAICASDMRAIHELNDQFHLTMFSACSNRQLYRLVREYMGLTLPIRAINLIYPDLLDNSWQQHELMVRYLQASDNWVLAQLCVDHVQPSKHAYLRRHYGEAGAENVKG